MSRTLNSIRNIKYAILGQGIGLLISFFSRMVFVNILSSEYLGLNGLFTNILSILTLAELGVGSAIVYSMYKPLAEKDEYRLKALMYLYRKTYITIGIIIAILGVSITPFLNFFIKDIPKISNIKLIYLMYVANTSISYFFSYKRSLIIADQNRYITTFYRYSFYFILNITQILILLFTKNFILYLAAQIINTFMENICISKKADQLYPFLKKKGSEKLDSLEKNIIIRNTKAIVLHKVGSTVVKGTDNLLIAKFVGIIEVGLYSNYQLIINALNMVFGLVFQSITASIGNLGATETQEKKVFIFKCINLLCFWIYAFASISLINLFNPFIKLWLGDGYLFPMSLILIIVINFYLTGMRKSVIAFKDALGLFWDDRYKPLFESGINLVVSIILAKSIGIVGIFIGTIVSTLATCYWIEPYVLFKHGLKISAYNYFVNYICYTFLMIIVGIITWFSCSFFLDYTLYGFVFKLIVCVIVPNVIFLIVFWKSKEFQYLVKIFKKYSTLFR